MQTVLQAEDEAAAKVYESGAGFERWIKSGSWDEVPQAAPIDVAAAEAAAADEIAQLTAAAQASGGLSRQGFAGHYQQGFARYCQQGPAHRCRAGRSGGHTCGICQLSPAIATVLRRFRIDPPEHALPHRSALQKFQGCADPASMGRCQGVGTF
jgi:hypothetical protein